MCFIQKMTWHLNRFIQKNDFSCFIYKHNTTHLYVTLRLHVWQDTCIYLTWHDAFILDTRRIHTWCVSFRQWLDTWCVSFSKMTFRGSFTNISSRIYMWHDAFICDGTHAYSWHDASIPDASHSKNALSSRLY